MAFHGADTGSNPVGDAIKINNLADMSGLSEHPCGQKRNLRENVPRAPLKRGKSMILEDSLKLSKDGAASQMLPLLQTQQNERGQPPATAHGVDIDGQGNGTVVEQRLYQLIRQPAPISDRQFEIEFLDSGVEAFDLTFD
jgi:hypothetical protein